MRKEVKYTTLDGRGESETFMDKVLGALEKLAPGEGLHIIKEFEPLPLYQLIEKRGLEIKFRILR
jgi:hypothetical protein